MWFPPPLPRCARCKHRVEAACSEVDVLTVEFRLTYYCHGETETVVLKQDELVRFNVTLDEGWQAFAGRALSSRTAPESP